MQMWCTQATEHLTWRNKSQSKMSTAAALMTQHTQPSLLCGTVLFGFVVTLESLEAFLTFHPALAWDQGRNLWPPAVAKAAASKAYSVTAAALSGDRSGCKLLLQQATFHIQTQKMVAAKCNLCILIDSLHCVAALTEILFDSTNYF